MAESLPGRYTDSAIADFRKAIELKKDNPDYWLKLIDFYNGLDRSAVFDGKDFDNMYMTSFLQLLINAGWKAKAVEVSNGWLEVDSVEDLDHYERMAEAGSLDAFYQANC